MEFWTEKEIKNQIRILRQKNQEPDRVGLSPAKGFPLTPVPGSGQIGTEPSILGIPCKIQPFLSPDLIQFDFGKDTIWIYKSPKRWNPSYREIRDWKDVKRLYNKWKNKKIK